MYRFGFLLLIGSIFFSACGEKAEVCKCVYKTYYDANPPACNKATEDTNIEEIYEECSFDDKLEKDEANGYVVEDFRNFIDESGERVYLPVYRKEW